MADRLTDAELREIVDTEDWALVDPRALILEVRELRAERDRLRDERDLYKGDAEGLRDRLRKVRTVVMVDGDRITIDQALLPLLWTGKPLERTDSGA